MDETNLTSIMQSSLEMIQKVMTATNEMSSATYVGEVEEGRVQATITGQGEISDITIHTLAKRRLDNHSLGEAVVAAVHAAEEQSAQAQRELLNGLPLGGLSPEQFMSDPQSFVPRFSEGKLGPAFDDLAQDR